MSRALEGLDGMGELVGNVRAAATAVFARFAGELNEPGLDAPLLWLLFNAAATRVTTEELRDLAGFVGEPGPLLQRAIDEGWLTEGEDYWQLCARTQQVLARLPAISDRMNRSWRERIATADHNASLDGALRLLRGGADVPRTVD